MSFAVYNKETTIKHKVNALTDYVKTLVDDYKSYYENISGVYETDINDMVPGEPYVVTVITNDGCTLSMYYTDSSKTQLAFLDETAEFAQLFRVGTDTVNFKRIYDYEQNFVLNDKKLFSYQFVTHKFLFNNEDKTKLYTKSTYTNANAKHLNLKESDKLIAQDTGYKVDKASVTTRMYKRNRIGSVEDSTPKEFKGALIKHPKKHYPNTSYGCIIS